MHFILAKINKALNDKGALGLFRLFMPADFTNGLRRWTINHMSSKTTTANKTKPNEITFNAYIGLEIGMSLLRFNRIRDYWSNKTFTGHEDFKSSMGRSQFQLIRSNVQFHGPNVEQEIKDKDPLWHSRPILEQFSKASSSLATCIGNSSQV